MFSSVFLLFNFLASEFCYSIPLAKVVAMKRYHLTSLRQLTMALCSSWRSSDAQTDDGQMEGARGSLLRRGCGVSRPDMPNVHAVGGWLGRSNSLSRADNTLPWFKLCREWMRL